MADQLCRQLKVCHFGWGMGHDGLRRCVTLLNAVEGAEWTRKNDDATVTEKEENGLLWIFARKEASTLRKN